MRLFGLAPGKTALDVPENYLSGSAGFSLEEEEETLPRNWNASAAAGDSAQQGLLPNPAALLTAFMAAAQSMTIKGALGKAKGEASQNSG